jgi:hypothetical protein
MIISSFKKTFYLTFILCLGLIYTVYGQQKFGIQNSKLKISVTIGSNGHITGDSLLARKGWTKQFDKRPFGVASDAGFKLNFMWTGWSAPGKARNGEDLLTLTQKNFKFDGSKKKKSKSGDKQLILTFKGTNTPLEVRVIYQLGKDQFYARKKLELRMTKLSGNYGYLGKPYIRRIWPVFTHLKTTGNIIKKGGLGQPTAMKLTNDSKAGAFWGMEFPTAQNELQKQDHSFLLKTGDYYGKQIGKDWFSSNWVVMGLTPQKDIRQWFMKYVSDIEAQPVRPYVLYNSWYDLRHPEIVHREKYIMNQKNSLRIIKMLRQQLTKKRGVKLDAFVLDDGWDTYKSPWKISEKRFPNGFKPLIKQLQKTDTDLGVWFGPIGGYSNRNVRVNWMKDHGYEVIPGTDELCLAGKKYHQLFKKRVSDFTKNRGVAYYKWDGIQFSCSDPSHGHPVGIYSRRAIMDSVISLDNAVWSENPDAFLNITSGTWLSPWWVKYATTIWMQGGDYGYSKIPSITRRDRAMTYRDWGLYNDYKTKDSWFPIANLMTHGLIKGRLQKLGAEEPLDKFADNAVLYFSRGIAMWELYISPDLLTDTQWNVIGRDIKWAKSRFGLLKHTVMVGGNPAKGETYGYAHFKGDRGILAVRNPKIDPQVLKMNLNKRLGLAEDADSLVVERVFPRKKISPVLISSGSELSFDLNGYETAIYEIFPLKDAQRPLLAGATFTASQTDSGYKINVLHVDPKDGGAHFLNPQKFPNVQRDNRKMSAEQVSMSASTPGQIVKKSVTSHPDDNQLALNIDVDSSLTQAKLAVLLKTKMDTKNNPSVVISVNGKQQKVKKQELAGHWGWYKIPLPSGKHEVNITLKQTKKLKSWSGLASLWLLGNQKVKTQTLTVQGQVKQPLFPMVVAPRGTIKRQQKLGSYNVSLK